MQNRIERFESIGAFCRETDRVVSAERKAKRGREFTGHESWANARENVLKGKLDVVPKANALIDELMGDGLQLEATVWEQSVAGFFPCVPAVLADQPECMYRPSQVGSKTAPVRIFTSVCCSGGVEPSDMEKRGITILALCMKLVSVRPVELYLYADMGGDGCAVMPIIKVETSPLDLSTATYALSSAGFLRQLCFSWAESYGWETKWAWDLAPWSEDARAKTSNALGATENDLVVIGSHLQDPLVDSPVEWINEQVTRFCADHEFA